MLRETFTFPDEDRNPIFVYHWSRDGAGKMPPKAVVQISHGMAETAYRYERFAQALTDAGYEVFANDHRGHGRTAGKLEQVGLTGADSFSKMTNTMARLTDLVADLYPGVPVYIFGHSMGSFLSQQYMYRFSAKASGVVLSGSNGKQSLAIHAGIALAGLLAAFKGDDHRSPLLTNLTFGSYNQEFRPNRTGFDWLSRDEAEVDRYVEDPYCGGLFSAGFYRDFFRGLVDIHRLSNLERIPRQLPVLLISGDCDPVGEMGRGVARLVAMYRELGMEDVVCKLYAGGRHELLNETNREEVMRDVIAWLDEKSGEEA
ncbi:alpha/beta hydrolase [Paenibacillus piri]|uniref:Alpha/beta hydrolase n=1 Tax=Paenibacillus piri TaxID=2547395 RepID=A0A4R5KZA8_9BACL|nr:alpha/beta hydrolase [Paenibacillus piri]TDG00983.1 alpha/beta hydrolase [Paenibacillus piri]